MFKDSCGNLSSAKILSFLGYITFLIVSVIILLIDPSRFDYSLFAIIAGGGGISSRIADKLISNHYGKDNYGGRESN